MLSGVIGETWDRVVASDPGLQRLRMALSVAVAMSTTIGVEYGLGRLTHAGARGLLVAILLGTVMAMLGSMALGGGTRPWAKVRTAVLFPVAMLVGMLPGTVVAGHTGLMLGVFVLVMFVAVFVRRFGPAYFFYGFMMWMGYFFAVFLHARLSDLPSLLVAVVVSTVWNLLLSVTVLRTHPRRTLDRVQRAYGARARAVASVCAELLESRHATERRVARLRRTLHSRQLRLAEAALMVEGWSAEPGALPAGWSASALRRRLLDAHLLIDEFATAAESLVLTRGRLTGSAAEIAKHLARREYRIAERLAVALLALDQAETDDDMAPGRDCFAQHLANAALGFTALAARAGSPPDTGDADEFAPAVALANGGLPGSGAVALDVAARAGWDRLNRISLTSRQAVQVAVAGGLAILAGRELSETRYYWAVIAAFIAFGGTATRAETSIKAGNRVLGTVLGLGVGVGLVHLTDGHTIWALVVIVVSMACGFYVVNVSYAGMIFFVTVMVAQLYSQLHEFTTGLLVLRLGETAIGAAIGIAVAVVVLPTGTRDTVDVARQRYFSALAALLRVAAGRFGGHAAGASVTGDLDALTRAVDLRLQQLALVARPLTRSVARPLVRGDNPHTVRHRLVLYAALTRQGRALALEARGARDRAPQPVISRACAALADAAELLAKTVPGSRTPAPEVIAKLSEAEVLLLSRQPSVARMRPAAERPLTQLPRLLGEVAVLSGAAQAPPALSVGNVPISARRSSGAATTGFWLDGQVRHDSGHPVAAALTLIDQRGHQYSRASADADGGYRIHVPARGSYVLIASALECRPAAVTVVAGTRPQRVMLTLSSPGELSGTVRDRAGAPVAGATVTLTDAHGEVVGAAVTSGEGGYACGVAPGAHTVVIVADRMRPAASLVVVPENGTLRHDVELAPATLLVGAVHAGDRVVADALVTVLDESGEPVAVVRTDDNGRYFVPGLPVGRYAVVTRGYPVVSSRVRVVGSWTTHDVELDHIEVAGPPVR